MTPRVSYNILAISIAVFFAQHSLFAQADLIVPQVGYSPNSISKEDIFSIEIDIKNEGIISAGQSFLFFYFSTDADFTDDEIISRVSVKPLSSGETTTASIVFPIPGPLSSGTYYLGFKVDAYDDISESNEDNFYYHPNKFTIKNTFIPNLKIPYPIIFVHGLNGDSDTWNSFTDEADLFYGLTFGGRMDFCLNFNDNTANSSFSTDYKDFTNLNSLNEGDYYYVNFAVNSNGATYSGNTSNSSRSNQSAVFKQGRAVRDAIKHVLDITGSEKVVLVGHSMGGLASREYLQNSAIYQSDGEHHVAKLLTIGTPHGGSNATFLGFGLNGIDELSEAVRDLRIKYYSGFEGCYLFGGTESTAQITGAPGFSFVNVDVNCNGTIGQAITGLNKKSYPTDLMYSSIIGYGDSFGGDGVVTEYSADINNQIAVNADTFKFKGNVPGGVLHTELHKKTSLVMKGIDEPNEFAVAYDIDFNELYFGFSTIQSATGYNVDYDDFRVVLNQPGKLTVSALNLPVGVFKINIVDENQQIISSTSSNGKSNLEKETQLQAGTYFVEFETEWTTLSYFFPYAFQVDFTPIVSTDEASEFTFESILSPNPASNEATLTYKITEADKIEIIIRDITGRIINIITQENCSIGENIVNLDLYSLPSGIYTYSIKSSQKLETKSFVVNK